MKPFDIERQKGDFFPRKEHWTELRQRLFGLETRAAALGNEKENSRFVNFRNKLNGPKAMLEFYADDDTPDNDAPKFFKECQSSLDWFDRYLSLLEKYPELKEKEFNDPAANITFLPEPDDVYLQKLEEKWAK